MVKQEYVLGFATNGYDVLLIRKTKPNWQAGLLNGIGGKIEKFDESPLAAMVREFKEETNIDTKQSDWKLIANMVSPEGSNITFNVHCFVNYMDWNDMVKYESPTEEKVELVKIRDCNYTNNEIVESLRVLVPLLCSSCFVHTTLVNELGSR